MSAEIDLAAAERRAAIAKAQSAVAHLLSVLAKGPDQAAYREAKAAARTLAWVAERLRS